MLYPWQKGGISMVNPLTGGIVWNENQQISAASPSLPWKYRMGPPSDVCW
jgi:hypothetical protein